MMTRNDKRLTKRNLFNQSISFEITNMNTEGVKNIQKVGFGIDISSKGVGMTTDYAFKKGDVLKLYLICNMVNITLPVYAKVVWSEFVNNNCRVGLLLLG